MDTELPETIGAVRRREKEAEGNMDVLWAVLDK